MPGRYYEVDEEGNIIDERLKDLYPRKEEEEKKMDNYSDDDPYYNRHSSPSPSRRRSPERYSNYSRRERSDDKPWETPFNPLQLAHSGFGNEETTKDHHHRHRHHHHKHRHHSEEQEKAKRRTFRVPEKKTTPADLKDRWGHELYIENIVLNPEPEPPRIPSNYEPPKEKWISKAGGVAIFTSRPTSASPYQGKS